MRIAVVHDYFTQMGGAEKVAEEIFLMMPDAALFSTVALPDLMPPSLRDLPVQTSWMQHLPLMQKYYRLYFLLYPLAVGSLDLCAYDLVVSSSSGYAKGVITSRDAIHVCYCHTPMRWVWNFDSYLARESMGWATRKLLPRVIGILREWDQGASRQPDHFVANSKVIAGRIQAAYGRAAEVIYPPIDLHRFRLVDEQDDYYVLLSRLVAYKRLDLAIKACTQLNRKLLVIGQGPYAPELMREAGPTVKFMGRLPNSEVEHLVSRCRALIFPGEEDFGMAPLEVAAAGRPCIAFRAGGAIETIIDGVTGVFFDRQEVEDVVSAIERFEQLEWPQHILRKHAEGFGIDVFQDRFRSFLRRVGAPIDAAAPIAPRPGAHSVPEMNVLEFPVMEYKERAR